MVLALLLSGALGGCTLGKAIGSSGAPRGTPSPSPSSIGFGQLGNGAVGPAQSPLPVLTENDYNARIGNSRAAAEAAIVVARDLYTKTGYWEVFVRVDPVTVPWKYDAAVPATLDQPQAGIQKVQLVMATEAGGSIKALQTAGESQEKEIIRHELALLEVRFPGASQYTVQVFFGESFQQATGTLSRGQFNLTITPAPH